MSDDNRPAIFIHSLFRSGSTYLFHVFRRAADGEGAPIYSAFQEPIHEAVFHYKDDVSGLSWFSGTGEVPALNHHPEIGAPYFSELVDLKGNWRGKIVEPIIYDGFFATAAVDETTDYIRSIVDEAPRRAVIQECRTALRIAPLKRALGGLHVALWRNAWDQWWSMKTTAYFDAAMCVALNGPNPPEIIVLLRKSIAFHEAPRASVFEQFAFYDAHRLSAEESYQAFFTLWMLALDEGVGAADFNLNIDQLSEDVAYRTAISNKFAEHGATGLSLDDADIPRAEYGEIDRNFFQPIETKVFDMLRACSWTEERLVHLNSVRSSALPKSNRQGGEKRLRTIIRRQETQTVKQFRAVLAAQAEGKSQVVESVARIEAVEKAAADSLRDMQERHDTNIGRLESERATLVGIIDKQADLLSSARLREADYVGMLDEADRLVTTLRRAQLEEGDRLVELTSQAAQLQQSLAERDRALRYTNSQIESLYGSTSWRVTAPLRGVRTSLNSLRNGIKSSVRLAAEPALHMVRRYPALKKPILKLTAFSPRIQSKLIHFSSVRTESQFANGGKPRRLLTPSPDSLAAWKNLTETDKPNE